MHRFKIVMRWLLGLLFMMTGTVHFLYPDILVRIMPSYLPWHLALVYLSGLFEFALGFGLLIPKCAPLAAWGLIALLIAVFPANIHMALNPELFPSISPLILWGRLPLQGVLITWVYWFTRRGN